MIDAAQDLQRQPIKFGMSHSVLYRYYFEVYFDALQVLYYLTHIQVNYLEVKLQAETESQLIITHLW